MAEIKTKPTSASVEDFINNLKDEQKRKDRFVLLELMQKATGEEPILHKTGVGCLDINKLEDIDTWQAPQSGRREDDTK